MGRRPQQTLDQRYRDDKQAYERGSTSQAAREMQIETMQYHCTPLKHSRSRTLTPARPGEDAGRRDGGRRDAGSLLVGTLGGTATSEGGGAASRHTRQTPTVRSSSQAPWFGPKGAKDSRPHRTCTRMFTHNRLNLGVTKMSFSRWLDKLRYI